MLYFVYELVDPRTDIVHYVGMTKDPNRRFAEHIGTRLPMSGRKRIGWVKDLLSIGIQPKMRILEIVDNWQEASIREQYWIQNYQSQGIALANAINGRRISAESRTIASDESEPRDEGNYAKRRRGPKSKTPVSGYVRYARALELFQPFDQNAFNYRVRAGDIQIQDDEHGRMYEVSSIQSIKEYLSNERNAGVHRDDFVIDWTTTEDFPSGIKLDMQVYDLNIALADAMVYRSWQKNNDNHLSIAAFNSDRSEQFASIKLIPLKDEQVAIDILSKKRSANDLRLDEIRRYDEPGLHTILAMDVVALPEYTFLIRRILLEWMKFWIEQCPERYVKRIYTHVTGESGLKMVKHFYMSPRYDLAPNAFMLDLAYPSASKIVRDLQNKWKEKAPLPPDLQLPL